jgi:hypothetical protein
LFPFTTEGGDIGLANFDVDSGGIISSRIIAGADETYIAANLFSRGAVSSVGDQLYFRYQRNYLDENTGQTKVEFVAQPINEASLANDGLEEIRFSETAVVNNFGGASSVGFSPQNFGTVNLPTGVELHLLADNGVKYLQVQPPLLADMPAADVPSHTLLPAGSHMETDADDLKAVIDFQEAVDDATSASLGINPIQNARIFIRNLGDGNELDLGQFNLTADDLLEATTQVGSNQYTMEQLLNGEYDPINESNTDDDLEPGEEVTTVLTLPIRDDEGTLIGHQQIFIPGIDQTEFLDRVEDFLVGYEQTTPTLPTEETTYRPTNTTWYPTNGTTTPRGIATTTRPGIGGGEANASGAVLAVMIAAVVVTVGTIVTLAVSRDARTAAANGLNMNLMKMVN